MYEPKAGNRIETIDVLRGLAALMVTWWHLFDPAVRYLRDDTLQAVATVAGRNGALGVYIFFVISGFVIPMAGVGGGSAGGRAIGYRAAIAKRMVRLYPPFLASILFAQALLIAALSAPGFAGHGGVASLWQIAANAAYLAPFVGVDWINPVFWTLLIEVQYYVLVYAVLRHIDGLTRPWLLLGTVAAALLPLTLHSYVLIFDFTDCFAAGFLVFLMVDGRIARPPGLAALGVALLVILLDKGGVTMAMAGATAWLCTVRGAAPRLLVGLGTISYSLYLTHFFVATKAFRLLKRYLPDNDAGTVAGYVLALAACILVAIVFYRVVERPAIGWSHRISARRNAGPRFTPPIF